MKVVPLCSYTQCCVEVYEDLPSWPVGFEQASSLPVWTLYLRALQTGCIFVDLFAHRPDLAVSNAEEDTQPVEFDLTLPEDPEALRQMKALPMSPAPPTPVKVDSPPDPIAPVDQETQEVPSALEDAPNKPAELGSSSQRVMPAAPMSQDQEGGMKEVAVVNSATHRKEYMRLKRMMEGQRGLGFPHMKRLFDSDNRVEKQQLLQTWVNQGENAEACEGYLVMRATQQHKGESKQELLTVRAVRAMGLSELLALNVFLTFVRLLVKNLDEIVSDMG